MEKGSTVAKKLDIPAEWEASAQEIIENKLQKILIVGATDRGKSTFIGFLSRNLREAKFQTAVVDADVGQKDIGPPSTITLGYPEGQADLSKVRPERFYFVGDVTPAGHLVPMVVGTQLLVKAAEAPFIIIDTTGLVHGIGRLLKGYKIEAVRPDVIVAIQKEGEIEPILRAHRNRRIIRLGPSPQAKPKTVDDRRQARERAFRRYFESAPDVALPVEQIIYQRSSFFDIEAPEESLHKNLLCGLADENDVCLGIGIIKKLDLKRKKLWVITPVNGKKIRVVQLGGLYLEPGGTQLGRRQWTA